MAGTPRRRPARFGVKGATRRPPARSGPRRYTARGPIGGSSAKPTRDPRRGAVMTTKRWVVLGSLMTLLALMLLPTGKSWYDQQQRLDELHSQVSAQESHVEELRRERELWQTDEYVEAQARKRLKFVRPGERTYTVVDPSAPIADVDPETGTVRSSDTQPWYEKMADSVTTADTAESDQ